MPDVHRYRQAERRLFDDAGIDPKEHRLPLATVGVEVRVLEVGEGAPTVFVPGGPNAAATWAYVAGGAPNRRWLLVDRPGTGLSDPPPSAPDVNALPHFVEQVTLDVLDALDVERASLVGSSLGGYSVLRFAAANPARVDRVVLAGCPAFVPGWRAPGFFTWLRAPLVGRLLLAAPVTASSARMSLKQMGHRRSLEADAIPAAMLEWVAAWQRDTDTMRHDGAMIRACGTWRGGFDLSLDLSPEILGTVEAPCLIIVGTDDPVGQEEVAQTLASLLPDAAVEVWAGAGHLPWLDDPQRMAASIGAFLGTAAPDRAGVVRPLDPAG
jgi:2-hydroxy-6-oxonona-2,4-dienedioate hydrolase